MTILPSRPAVAAVLLAFGLLAAPATAVDSSPVLGGAELPLATVHLAAAAAVPALSALDQPPPEEPEPQPQPFPAPPEQPPAERPPDQPPPETEGEDEPDVDIDVAIPDEPEIEVPDIEPPEVEVETEEETAWYLDPLWILVALAFLVVVLVLIFSGRRRS